MTCWPRGKGGLPTRNREMSRPRLQQIHWPHKQQDWGAVCSLRVLQNSQPRPEPSSLCSGTLVSCEHLLPATVLALTFGDPCPQQHLVIQPPDLHSSHGLLFWSQSLIHTMPHLLFGAALDVLEVAVLYQNGKGKPTTFLFRIFLRYIGL